MTSKFTPKQEQVLRRVLNDDFFICGLHGAKRSGKTVLNNVVFGNEIARVREIADKLNIDEPMYILAGTSSTSIQNNIIQELYNMFGIEPKYDKHGAFTLCGVKIIQVYTCQNYSSIYWFDFWFEACPWFHGFWCLHKRGIIGQ